MIFIRFEVTRWSHKNWGCRLQSATPHYCAESERETQHSLLPLLCPPPPKIYIWLPDSHACRYKSRSVCQVHQIHQISIAGVEILWVVFSQTQQINFKPLYNKSQNTNVDVYIVFWMRNRSWIEKTNTNDLLANYLNGQAHCNNKKRNNILSIYLLGLYVRVMLILYLPVQSCISMRSRVLRVSD